MSNRFLFTTGGTVPPNDGNYIARQADDDLLELCQQGRFAYVLTARQMGKSSLMVATANTLRQQEIRPVIIDLTQIGSQTASAAEWYLGVLRILARQLRLNAQLTEFWNGHSDLSVTQRFTQFFEAVVLPQIEAPIVVFVDEIDSTLSLGFTDDFFIAIRYFYTARAQNPAFNRLSFVLVGVATPSELISDQKRTPFNIGERVDLTDFTFNEALPLAQGLGLPEAEGPQVLRWVLAWTGGHPYLTQRLCKEIAEQGRATWTEADVEALTGQLLFGDRREQDNNLQFVRDMLTRRTPDNDVLGVLGTYRQIRRGRLPVMDEDQSVVKAHLKLSGVVKREEQQLQVRNPIYSSVFDLKWVREQWPETWWERLKPAMPLIAGLSAVAVGMGGLAWYANSQRLNAIAAATEAETERDNAQEAEQRALTAEQSATERLTEAEEARRRAVKQEKLAEERRKEAESAKQETEDQRQQAVLAQQAEAMQRREAESARVAESKQRSVAEQRRQDAEMATKDAVAQQNVALARQLTAQANWVREQRLNALPLSILLSVEAMQRLKNQPAARGDADFALRELKQLAPEVNRIAHDAAVSAVSFSPDGRYLLTSSSSIAEVHFLNWTVGSSRWSKRMKIRKTDIQ